MRQWKLFSAETGAALKIENFNHGFFAPSFSIVPGGTWIVFRISFAQG
jgi:hypothetical protein